MVNILYVEDCLMQKQLIEDFFKNNNYSFYHTTTAVDAIKIYIEHESNLNLIVSDNNLDSSSYAGIETGIDLMYFVRKLNKKIPFFC